MTRRSTRRSTIRTVVYEDDADSFEVDGASEHDEEAFDQDLSDTEQQPGTPVDANTPEDMEEEEDDEVFLKQRMRKVADSTIEEVWRPLPEQITDTVKQMIRECIQDILAEHRHHLQQNARPSMQRKRSKHSQRQQTRRRKRRSSSYDEFDQDYVDDDEEESDYSGDDMISEVDMAQELTRMEQAIMAELSSNRFPNIERAIINYVDRLDSACDALSNAVRVAQRTSTKLDEALEAKQSLIDDLCAAT
ncbi:hypothetical protein GQ42DRAFT_154348 [Ramicandelaber brevisporus]|nr:hypothetical protein GQ42DRAFT_154348 [Ramicandelaber brevisporus]